MAFPNGFPVNLSNGLSLFQWMLTVSFSGIFQWTFKFCEFWYAIFYPDKFQHSLMRYQLASLCTGSKNNQDHGSEGLANHQMWYFCYTPGYLIFGPPGPGHCFFA